MTKRQRRSKSKVKRARHKRERIPEFAESCECDAHGMEGRQHFSTCAAEAAKATRQHTRRVNQSASWVEKRLAENKAKRQAMCMFGKRCKCETNKEFIGCPNNSTSLLYGSVMHDMKIKPGKQMKNQYSRISKDTFDPGFMMHYRVGDGGFAQILAKAFAAGHGATVSNGPFDYLAAGTEIHKAIEAMQDEVRTDAPGVRLKAAEHACTIYELLGAYADVITRRTGKSPLLAAPYGKRRILYAPKDALAFLSKKRSNRA